MPKPLKPDGYTPVTREQVTDLELLPRRFDLLAMEIRALVDVLNIKVIPAIASISERIGTLETEQTSLMSAMHDLKSHTGG